MSAAETGFVKLPYACSVAEALRKYSENEVAAMGMIAEFLVQI